MHSLVHCNRPVVAVSGLVASLQLKSCRSCLLVPHFLPARSWFPTKETIDEGDRQKRIFIHSRFEDVDKDKNGRIDMQELRSVLESAVYESEGPLMQHWLSDQEVDRLMNQYDLDHSGDLTVDEFEKLVNDGLLLAEKLSDYQKAFEAVDTDNNGGVSADELALALSRLGWPESECSTDKVTQLMSRFDVDSQGHLGLASFMALMKDNMLDAREVLAYMGARPQSPSTTQAVIHAVSAEGFSLIMSADDLENALNRASSRDHVLLLMAGATWCSDSRAIVQHVKAIAGAYPSVDVCMLWGNVNPTTKELFRDQLLVRSTPAFFVFQSGDLVVHWSGGDVRKLEQELRKRLPAGAEMPAEPLF